MTFSDSLGTFGALWSVAVTLGGGRVTHSTLYVTIYKLPWNITANSTATWTSSMLPITVRRRERNKEEEPEHLEPRHLVTEAVEAAVETDRGSVSVFTL